MADLSIGTGSGGSQGTTQSPQSLVNPGEGTESSSKVQPGTATNLLNNGNGISLGNSTLSTVDLNSTSSGSVAPISSAGSQTQAKHVNTTLLGLCVALFVIAIISFWIVSRSEKNTTNY